MAYFTKRSRTFCKNGPWTFEKTDLYQNLLYELKTHFWQILGCWFQIWQNRFQLPAQKYKNQTFLVQNIRIFTDFKALTSTVTIVAAQKYPNKAFLIPNLFTVILQLDKFQDFNFEIWQYFLKYPAHKYPNKVFLVPNLGIFILTRNFAIRQIRGQWFQIWQKYFEIPAPKRANQAFLVPNLRIFNFYTKLYNKTNSRALISNMTIDFQKCCPKHCKKAIFGTKFKKFYFSTKIWN